MSYPDEADPVGALIICTDCGMERPEAPHCNQGWCVEYLEKRQRIVASIFVTRPKRAPTGLTPGGAFDLRPCRKCGRNVAHSFKTGRVHSQHLFWCIPAKPKEESTS